MIIWKNENLAKVLSQGGVAVMPTDTIYGLVGKAEDKNTVERIYNIKGRAPEKPCIILISDFSQLNKFSVNVSYSQKEKIKEYWPSPVSIILECSNENLEYLHRGTNSLAFRMPESEPLRNLLFLTGPLVAPSANPEGAVPAKSIQEARDYFGNKVDFYADGGTIEGSPSRLIKLHNDGSITILR